MMKRRDFITKGTAGSLGLGLAGCSLFKPRKIMLEPELVPFSFGDNYPRPKGGTMPMAELGRTGIKVSKFGFGSHMRPYLVPYVKERERMIREAYDFGVNLFDIYDKGDDIFQYEPMGRYLAPMINDVVISIVIRPYDGRTLEEEFERDLRLFGRDYIDMVRVQSFAKDDDKWWQWEPVFKYKEQGKIRAVGLPIHTWEDLAAIYTYPVDYVIFPYNFFMNVAWYGFRTDIDFKPLPELLRDRGIGVITMKPFAGDYLIYPLMKVAETLKEDKEVNFIQACLRYVINSGINPDTTLVGMYYPSHVYEDVEAYFKPHMTDEERRLLNKVRRVAKTKVNAWLPDHYKFLEKWVPDYFCDETQYSSA